MIRRIMIAAGALLTAIMLLMYRSQYFRWRGCFNEEGRCFDPSSGVVYHAQSGPVWLTLAAISAGLTVWLVLARKR